MLELFIYLGSTIRFHTHCEKAGPKHVSQSQPSVGWVTDYDDTITINS